MKKDIGQELQTEKTLTEDQKKKAAEYLTEISAIKGDIVLRDMIKENINRSGLTLLNYSQKIGIHSQHLGAYLKGKRSLPYKSLVQIIGSNNIIYKI